MTDAPKIDTQAPERHADKARNVILNRALMDLDRIINGHDPENDTNLNNLVWDRLDKMAVEIEARADARAAAAVQAMRERCADMVEREGHSLHVAIRHAPLPDTTALDRLIAERVRATFDEAIAIVAEYDFEPLSHDLIRRLEAARGSKEGQS